MTKKNLVIKEVLKFYLKSSDFNGIPLSRLAEQIDMKYFDLLPILSQLISENNVSIQAGVNPHIIRKEHYDIKTQLKFLKEAEKNEVKSKKIGPINFEFESHLLCIYPSSVYLKENYSASKYNSRPFTKRLALGEPQLKWDFFEIDILERYFNDPRYRFEFEDYSGKISVVEPQKASSSLQEKDEVFLETFGLGYDNSENRVAVAYLRYLSHLPSDHQKFWKSKLAKSPCKMVKEYYQNTMNGDWVSNQSLFSAFIEEQRVINEMSLLIVGKPLFRKTFENEKRPKEFTFFLSPTLSNYESFINLLDKMISENINKDFFKNTIPEFEMEPISGGVVERKLKGTLRLLDEWLRKHYRAQDPNLYIKLMAPLKEVRNKRQRPAHKISQNYHDKDFFKEQMDILEKVCESLAYIRIIFQQHPRAASIKIPQWLEQGEIMKF